MSELGRIDDAIAALEAQRPLLGDVVVDTAVKPLREQRAALTGRVGTEQRKLVTILFSDVVDFTVVSQQLDAEDVRTLMNAYFVRWNEHVEAQGGVVEKFIGDAVMAVFGIHRADEEDPHHAIRAALAIRDSLGALNAEVGSELGVTIDIRVGIDTGDVVVSTLDDRPGQDFVVVGEVVNRASRIQGAAPPGGILISSDTYRHVRGAFAAQPMSGLQLKGIVEPVDALLIQGERAIGFAVDERRGVEGVETRTVGRELELSQLQNHFHEVVEDRHWQVVTVVGDAGVGKSRLVSDFARWLDELPDLVWWFGGRAAHSGPGLPYALLHELFATRFEIHDSDAPAEVRRKWEHGVERAFGSGPDSAKRAHVIARWLGFELGPIAAEFDIDDPRTVGEQGMATLAEYFRLLAEQAPVVLFFEDLHWADEALLDLIHAADKAFRDCRVLVVATARPDLLETRPHWGEGLAFHTSMSLAALSRHATRRLLADIMQKAEHVPQSMVELVVEASEGNPFYVEELVKWLIDARVITKDSEADGGGWHVSDERLETSAVPATLRSVLQARLDALTVNERLALQRASVIGRIFWDDAVESLRTDEDLPAAEMPTGEALDRLRQREVVYQREQSVFEHTREFLFKHALLRDVAYDGVLRRRRRLYHAFAARWLEQVAARTERTDQYAGLIADHLARAGDEEAAARWYLAAGRQATSVNGLADARRLLEIGLRLAPPSPASLRFDLLLAHETVLDRLGDRAAQRVDLAALDDLESFVGDADPERLVRLLLSRSRWLFHHTEYDVQAATSQRAIDIAEREGLELLGNEACLWLGKGLTWRGDNEAARETLEAVLGRARAIGHRRVITESLRYLAIVAGNRGEFETAKHLLDETIAINRDAHDSEGESTALVQLATVYFNEGRFGESREILERALPVVMASEFRYRESVVVANLAAIVTQQGELAYGKQLITRGIELATELGDQEGTATAYTVLGEIERRAGDFTAAERSLQLVLDNVPEGLHEAVASDAYLNLALCASAQGRADEALAHAVSAVTHGERGDSPLAVTRAQVAMGYAQLARGDDDAAAAAFGAARVAADALGTVYLATEAEAALARLALRRSDRDEALRLTIGVFVALDNPDIGGAVIPAAVFGACWEVLEALGDPRAPDARSRAERYLAEAADRIGDDEMRDGFLHRAPSNVALAARLAGGPTRTGPGLP